MKSSIQEMVNQIRGFTLTMLERTPGGIIHALQDEPKHQGEMYLLFKLFRV